LKQLCGFCGASWWHVTGRAPRRPGCGLLRQIQPFLNASDPSSWSLDERLWDACGSRDLVLHSPEYIQSLLEAKASPNASLRGRTAIEHLMCRRPATDAAEVIIHLLNAGLELPSISNIAHSRDLATMSILTGGPNVCRLLLKAPLNVWVQPPVVIDNKSSPLVAAATWEHVDRNVLATKVAGMGTHLGIDGICKQTSRNWILPLSDEAIVQSIQLHQGAIHVVPWLAFAHSVDFSKHPIVPEPTHAPQLSHDLLATCPWPIDSIVNVMEPKGIWLTIRF
jgi:hypothetical protein